MVLCTHQFVDFEPIFFFSFPVLPAAAKTIHPIWGLLFILLLFQYIYHCINIRVQQHKIIICLFLLYLLVKLTPCRFSFVGSHRSNSHSCVCQPAARLPPGVKKKRTRKTQRLVLIAAPFPLSDGCSHYSTGNNSRVQKMKLHAFLAKEVECMPSRYSQGCNLWNNLCHCIKKKRNYQVFCLICYKGEKKLFYMDEWGWDFVFFFCFHVCSENKN